MVHGGWKKHMFEMRKGTKFFFLKKTVVTRRKENGTRETCVQKRKTREQRKTQRE